MLEERRDLFLGGEATGRWLPLQPMAQHVQIPTRSLEGFYGFVVVAAVSTREHEVWEGMCGGIQGKLEMGDYGGTYDHNTLYTYRKFSKKIIHMLHKKRKMNARPL